MEEFRMSQVMQAAAMGLASQSHSLRANAMVLARGVSARAAGGQEVTGPWVIRGRVIRQLHQLLAELGRRA